MFKTFTVLIIFIQKSVFFRLFVLAWNNYWFPFFAGSNWVALESTKGQIWRLHYSQAVKVCLNPPYNKPWYQFSQIRIPIG